jgi:hypothetical protein
MARSSRNVTKIDTYNCPVSSWRKIALQEQNLKNYFIARF